LDISGLHEFMDNICNYLTKSTLCVIAKYIHTLNSQLVFTAL